jgi:glycosyltransferase involved in cell wall biosynthesis
MKILVLPRDEGTPYQSLLYREMRHFGGQVSYIGQLTPIHTLNLLLLPVEIAARRINGARLIHLHWVFGFTLPGARHFPAMRWLAQVWFAICLRACRTLGMHLVWTAHNALPHEPVFADDVSARRALVEASDLVLAHSRSTLDELAALGAVVHRSAVIRHGPIGPVGSAGSLRFPGADGGPRRFLYFGRVREYKGVDDLLAAFAAIPGGVAAHLTVAGQCDDPALRSRVGELARRAGPNVLLRLERVPDDEVTQLLAAADVVVLPYRRVSTSGTAMLALSHGRPLIVPDLAGLANLPDKAVLRYNGQIPALTALLVGLARADEDTLAAMSSAAYTYTAEMTWREIAGQTMSEMKAVLGDAQQAGAHGERVKVP